MHNLVIFGGTFDPIHFGHINTAINVQNYFNFSSFVFVPCKIPLLKNHATASSEQRIEMINLALAEQDEDKHFSVDLCEINRDTPSYTVETLTHFRHHYGKQIALTLLMGIDTFNQLPKWHAWKEILTLCNILVINRAGYESAPQSETIRELIQTHQTSDAKVMTQQSSGLIYFFDAGNYDISSSWIRQQLAARVNLNNYLPEAIIKYIQQNNLYSRVC